MSESVMKTASAGKQDVAPQTLAPDVEDVESGPNNHADKSLKKKILRIIWDSLDKSPEERSFVSKVDSWVMSYVCVAYFVKYLDQTNVVNGYVSGMKEDLNMDGQDYNLLQTMFTAGYCIGNIPSQLIMTKVRPSIWLPSLELIWGVLVMAMAAAKNVETLYVLRFFIGILEASAHPGFATLLGNWYTPQELGKRSCIFFSSALVSQMFSGYLQDGFYSGMDHKHDLRAWRWLFIFDGIIGIPVSVYGFFVVPDSPSTTRARWLKPEQKALAVARMQRVGLKPPKKLTWRTMADVFTFLARNRIYNYFTIYLKSTGRYTVEEVNVIPSAGFGFATFITLLIAWVSDGTGQRAPSIFFAASLSIIGCIILSVYPVHNQTAMIAGWILTYGQNGASALIMAWINELLSFSAEQRLLVIGVIETAGFVMVAWVMLFTYPSGEAPKFSVGYEVASMFFAIEVVAIAAVLLCEKKWKPGPKVDDGAALFVL